MRIYNYSEARQNFTTVLNTALKEEVIIKRKDGSKFKIVPIEDNPKKGKSPPTSTHRRPRRSFTVTLLLSSRCFWPVFQYPELPSDSTDVSVPVAIVIMFLCLCCSHRVSRAAWYREADVDHPIGVCGHACGGGVGCVCVPVMSWQCHGYVQTSA